MPHGGGHHHGGGFHGGGHHHHHRGGGFHHHHGGFHRHHHHYRRGGYIGFYDRPYYGYRRRPFSWVIFTIFVTVVIIVTTSVSVRYTASGDDDDMEYGPTDTRVLSISNTLCQSARISVVDDATSGYEVYLYTLNSPPQLTGRESFSRFEQPSFDAGFTEFNYYYYYMPKGSNISMSACIVSGQPEITFYMIKGHKRFVNWQDDYGHYEDHFRIRSLCDSGNKSYTYNVKSDDFYYLVFDSHLSSTDAIKIFMNFERTRYEINNDSIADFCVRETSVISDGCSLSLPVSHTTTLLKVSPLEGTEIDWAFAVSVDVGCSARIWMYFLISLSVLVGVVGIMATVFALLYFFCIRPKKRASASVTTTPATVTASPANLDATMNVEKPEAPLLHEVPPPTNPAYPQAAVPPQYGTAPPQYGVAPPPYKQ